MLAPLPRVERIDRVAAGTHRVTLTATAPLDAAAMVAQRDHMAMVDWAADRASFEVRIYDAGGNLVDVPLGAVTLGRYSFDFTERGGT